MSERYPPLSHLGRHDLEKLCERLETELTHVTNNLTSVQQRSSEQTEEIRALKRGIIDEQVRAFHDVMGIETRTALGAPSDEVVRLRMRLVIEEAFEFLIATAMEGPYRAAFMSMLDDVLHVASLSDVKPDLVEVADALADLDYVVAGTRLAYGIPRAPVADEVHRSNMAKAPGGKVYRDEHGKVMKPPGWTPPDIRGVLGLVKDCK